MLTMDPWDILDVTTELIKLDPKVVLNDWDNRQIPRFKYVNCRVNTYKLCGTVRFLNVPSDSY